MDFRIDDPVCSVWGTVTPAGHDCSIAIMGGQAPHVGCAVLAEPRSSLTGVGTSATVSVLNRTGHMDDAIATTVAKQVASKRNCAVACSCGIHLDNASPETIAHIRELTNRITEYVLGLLEQADSE